MWPYPRIIAHRGGGSLAPENTLEAFQRGFNSGFRAVEFDVMLTKDLVPVVIHDEEFGRTIEGEGRISDFLAMDLQKLDAGSWFGPEFAHSRVPTYRDVLDFCTQHDIWMNVEIKPAKGFEELTGEVVAEATREFYQKINFELPLISSFNLNALAVAQSILPAFPRGLLFDQLPADWLQQLQQFDAVSLHTNQKYLTQQLVEEIKQTGFHLCCYTVNDVIRAHNLLSWGVDALFTDNLTAVGPDFV